LRRSAGARLDDLVSAVPVIVNTSTLSSNGADSRSRSSAAPSYPVTDTRVAEVVRGQVTTGEAFEVVRSFARVLGKVPIEEFESPGFVATRVVMPLINEAVHVVMEGVATAAEVDLCLKLGYEFRTGPLEWADRVGLHKVLIWLDYLFRETGDPKFRPCPLLRKMVRAGHTGARKKGVLHLDRAQPVDRPTDDTPRA
jgi:3-hydroxybutyryl-CoA dehydrogenase